MKIFLESNYKKRGYPDATKVAENPETEQNEPRKETAVESFCDHDQLAGQKGSDNGLTVLTQGSMWGRPNSIPTITQRLITIKGEVWMAPNDEAELYQILLVPENRHKFKKKKRLEVL